jgi:transcriptional regulator with XRE-family HTH domain
MQFNPTLLLTMRKARKWSRNKLAERSSVTAQTIWEIESGRTLNPTTPTVNSLAGAFDVEPAVFYSPNTNLSYQTVASAAS